MKKLLLYLLLLTSFNLAAQTNNYSLEFDGNDDYILIGDQHNFGMNSSTICLWLQPHNLSSSNQQNIISKSWQGGYKIDITPNSDSLRFWLKSPSSAVEFKIYSSAFLLNAWSFITLVIDRVNNLSKLYIDGNLINELDISLLGDLDNSTNLHFGSHYWLNTGQIAEYFEGAIDLVSFWNISLDSNQIQQYMACPPTGNETGLVGYWNFEEGSGTATADQTSNANDGTLNGGVTWSTDVPPYNCNTSTNELNNSIIKLFPNPSNSIITLTLAQHSKGQIILTDILGKVVLSKSFNTNQVELVLKGLKSKGTYFAKVLDSAGNVIAIKKLIYQ